jgi:hypothetical protein
MKIILHFKNQVPVKNTDLKMLKRGIKQWNKCYGKITETYVIGNYTKSEEEEIKEFLGTDFFNRYNIQIINAPMTPTGEKIIKTHIINYQVVFAYNYFGGDEEFISAHIDVFPIKKLTDEDLNKEYKILFNDYTQIKNPDSLGWFQRMEWHILDFLKKKYPEMENRKMYYHHSFYKITPEFMEWWTQCDSEHKMNYSAMLCYFNIIKGENVYVPDMLGITYYKNKFVWDNKKLSNYKGINVTKPWESNSIRIMKKLKIY